MLLESRVGDSSERRAEFVSHTFAIRAGKDLRGLEMNWPWSKIKVTLSNVCAEIQALRECVDRLANITHSLVKRYQCIICGSEFARLPHQSDKRCPHCQAQIKEVSGINSGNSNHRGAGHNTRGMHKKFGSL